MSNKNTLRHDTSERHSKKYENTSFLHQLVLGRFLDCCASHIKPHENSKVLDFGCGEAFFWQEMQKRDVNMQNLTGMDLRDDALATAAQQFPEHTFIKQDLLECDDKHEKYDVVIASQVLEHLPEPEKFLEKLSLLCKPEGLLILTVPWEPFFMLSNLARGRDILRLGNHPEHINLWGVSGFKKFVKKQTDIQQTQAVFPFQLISATPR